MTEASGGGEPTDLTLEDVLTSAAEDLDGVQGVTTGATIAWRLGATDFAVLEQHRAEFRLDPLVARAALRTPDTTPSPRGTDWVAFAPEVLDEGAVDRAEAWFLSAYRRAAKAG